MSEACSAVVLGRNNADIYCSYGQAGPGFDPSVEKAPWENPRDDQLLIQYLKNPETTVYPGGGGLNVASYLAVHMPGRVGLISAANHGPMGRILSAHLERLGVEDHVIYSDEYPPAINLVERTDEGSFVRRSPQELRVLVTTEHIERYTEGAQVLVAASVKDPDLTEHFLRAGDPRSIKIYNPGGDDPRAAHGIVQEIKPITVSNWREAVSIHGKTSDPDTLAARSVEDSPMSVITLGAEGILLIRRTPLSNKAEIRHHRVEPIKPEDPVGAGDRLLAEFARQVAIGGTALNGQLGEFFDNLTEATRSVLLAEGGHGDLMPPGYTQGITQKFRDHFAGAKIY